MIALLLKRKRDNGERAHCTVTQYNEWIYSVVTYGREMFTFLITLTLNDLESWGPKYIIDRARMEHTVLYFEILAIPTQLHI